MDDMERWESGASEVIGAVLLVSLVVIGGAVVASMVFGQPTPKEVPHVSFGVSMDDSSDVLTLHHTGGDTLLPGEYNVTVFYTDGTTYKAPNADTSVTWSSDGDMNITGVNKPVGDVVLSFLDAGGGETVLRRVPFEDIVPVPVVTTIPDWTISGFKLNASGGAYTGPPVTITLYQKMPGNDNWPPFGTPTTTDGNGFYIFDVLKETETYRIIEDPPDGWRAFNPASGMIDNVKLNPGHIVAVNQNFTNELIPIPPPPTTISGHKWNTTPPNAQNTPQAGVMIVLERLEGSSWVEVGRHQTDASGYYEFEVPDDDSTYRLSEEIDRNVWICTPNDGVITGVAAGDANRDFSNRLAPLFISGHKFRVDENGNTMTSSPFMSGITIYLERQNGNKWTKVAETTTDDNGYFEFPAPTDGGIYRLREVFNALRYTPYNQTDGIISGVLPGSTDNNFYNKPIIGPGIVMYLNKTVEDDGDNLDDDGGYMVDGTYLQGDARNGNWVTINGHKYEFGNNEQFRFTIVGDQYSGELLGNENLDLTSLTFNVLFQVNRNGEWVTPAGMGSDPVIGRPSQIHIEQINKNKINEQSTLTYRFPQNTPTDTLLRLNGEIVIDERDPPGDNQYLEFTELHIVHDNRYHEGNNVMWINLMPEYDYVLVQGTCLSP